MSLLEFPSTDLADENGLLALGGNLEVQNLLKAYKLGIFPWPISKEYPLAWFSPNPRGIIEIENFHLSKSFKKFLKKDPYQIKFNQNFISVIEHCAKSKNRKTGLQTWITEDLKRAYIDLFNEGHAYSCEAYQDGILVGGVYGVHIGAFFSGESMFYLRPNASKVALYYLCQKIGELGGTWLDTQMVTEVVEGLGGKEIPREIFEMRLFRAISMAQKPFFANYPL